MIPTPSLQVSDQVRLGGRHRHRGQGNRHRHDAAEDDGGDGLLRVVVRSAAPQGPRRHRVSNEREWRPLFSPFLESTEKSVTHHVRFPAIRLLQAFIFALST